MTRFVLTLTAAALFCATCALIGAELLYLPWALAGTKPFGTSPAPAAEVWTPVAALTLSLILTVAALIAVSRSRRRHGGRPPSPRATE